MTTSPFMTPGESRRRREKSRRRRRLRALAGSVLALAIVGASVAIGLASSHGSSRSPARTHAAKGPGASAQAVAPVSPAGLQLGRPPLALTGIAAPSQDPVRLAFHTPPRAGLLFNLDSGEVLWQRNPYRRLEIASLTKMMTALITVKSAPPAALVRVTRQAVDSNGSKVGVLPLGRRVRLETMLYGLMLPSGNDAAIALAQHIAGSSGRFVQQMNAEAARLGMGCTRYSSPSGYVDRGNYSCTADLAVLARVDLEQPRIAKVTRTRSAALPFPIKGGKLYLYNNNPLLIYGYPGTTGLKTGYTAAAGRCLVATATRRGIRLGVVLLDSPDPATQASRLLNRGFERVYHLPRVPGHPIPAGA
jgi:serine-type D-Ala-D-Ala carboxypeptidase (penicillin-binding protein 5/6)